MPKVLVFVLLIALVSGCSRDKMKIVEAVERSNEAGEEAQDAVPTDPDARFLYENAQNEDIIVRPSGLQIRIIKKGNGPIPTPRSTVTTHYHGTLIDGTVFDSTRESGTPFSFPLEAVIDGWQEGLMLMQEGAIYQLFIPADLAYGDAGSGTSVPPGATLIFEVELVDVQNPLQPLGSGQ